MEDVRKDKKGRQCVVNTICRPFLAQYECQCEEYRKNDRKRDYPVVCMGC